MPNERTCGCKGIRTCLLCEKGSSVVTKSNLSEEAKRTYTYCPDCDLCWPDGDRFGEPLFLGGVKIFPDFISKPEEAGFVSDIDNIAWVSSQSGRRKQDFGPKVNFKKKKVRIGEFRGFPQFTSLVLQRFQSFPGLSDFRPVELCHLEYTPERGSCIDPHIDDFWLWGERLVTINLGSPTVLTLVPSTDGPCGCLERSTNLLPTIGPCRHGSSHVTAVESACAVSTDRNESDYDPTVGSCHHRSSHVPAVESTVLTDRKESDYDGSSQNRERNEFQNGHTEQDCLFRGGSSPSDSSTARDQTGTNLRTMCSSFRNSCCVAKVGVRVALPPRSLVVLAGCARYNWTHEIRRRDIVSRRLAMTFRELTPEFLDGGEESVLGKELLTIADKFCDL